MKKILFIVFLSLSIASYNSAIAQNKFIIADSLFEKFQELYDSNEILDAETCLLKILTFKEQLPAEYIGSAYNNLGLINIILGRFHQSLVYFDKAEIMMTGDSGMVKLLALIYSNKSRIYNIQKNYSTAIEYLEKGIRIYNGIKKPSKEEYQKISSAYMNLGLSYFGLKDYNNSMKYLQMSAFIKHEYNFPLLALCYLNIASTYAAMNETKNAETYFLKSIRGFETGTQFEYQRIVDAYFEYGSFLRTNGREKEAFEYHRKALALSLKNFGPKHPYVSQSYSYIGDHYSELADYSRALQNYQQAIISLVTDFDDTDYNLNPSIDSASVDVYLLKILQKKSETLEKLSMQQPKPEASSHSLVKSLETIELALKLTSRIRNEYLSADSRLYLVDNEKESYIYAVYLSRKLFSMTNDPFYLYKMYSIARQAKSAVLHNEITDNELQYSIGIPDSLLAERSRIKSNIAAYNYLIHEEAKNTSPDKTKTDLWKDELFNASREKEKLDLRINTINPQYHDLLQNNEPIGLQEIQNHLQKDETLIEYLLSNKYEQGKRKLYIFIVSKKDLQYREVLLDSLFIKNTAIINDNTHGSGQDRNYNQNFRNFTSALYSMYEILVKPVENALTGTKIILVPDEEIAYLPFDAFINKPATNGQTNYDGLDYLVKSYSFSYGYSSSHVFRKEMGRVLSKKVYSFAPDYNNPGGNKVSGLEELGGAGSETRAIYKYFSGKEYPGELATESNFKSVMNQVAIFHLAMHSLSDSSNSKFSCLVFNPGEDKANDGKLYDYEISLSRMKSPMVVLSACNTGSGILYHGEGVMSISRAFLLAGASSVIKTQWDINDDASARIISSFYYYLSVGQEKDDALRHSKLDYLENTVPVYTNPYYWAGYQVMGDKSAIARNRNACRLLTAMLLLFLFGGFAFVFYKRRRIFRAWLW